MTWYSNNTDFVDYARKPWKRPPAKEYDELAHVLIYTTPFGSMFHQAQWWSDAPKGRVWAVDIHSHQALLLKRVYDRVRNEETGRMVNGTQVGWEVEKYVKSSSSRL